MFQLLPTHVLFYGGKSFIMDAESFLGFQQGLFLMIIILSTYPTRKSADKAAKDMVQKKLAACISIMPLEKSVYHWEGKIQQDKEWLLLIKTKERLFKKVETHIKANHPYSSPEIIGFKMDKITSSYKKWLTENTM
jgi:uncharacterized protein involved in tolerance to divalent cations